MAHPTTISSIKRILLIEESPFIVEALQEAMRRYGYELHSAKNAEAGIEAMGLERFCTVICNYHLAGMNGLEFFWRSRNLFERMTGILTASSGDNFLANAARLAGADYFMEMPFRIEDLLGYIHAGKRRKNDHTADFSFLNHVQAYSRARRARDAASTSGSQVLASGQTNARITEIIGPSGATLSVIHNDAHSAGGKPVRPKLKIVHRQNKAE